MQELEKFKKVTKEQKDQFYQFATHYLDKPVRRYRDIRLNRAGGGDIQSRADVYLRFLQHMEYVQSLIDEDEKKLCDIIRREYNGVFYIPYEEVKLVPESVVVRTLDNNVSEHEDTLKIHDMEGDEDWKAALKQERKDGRYTK